VHELSIAQSLVDRAVETAAEHGADRIDRLDLAVGEATHLDPDQLAFCVETVAADTPAADADVVVDAIAPEGVCDCGWSGEPETLSGLPMAAPDLRCPACGERVDLTAGTECRLARISVPEPAEE
jgi:hydrogenase nickel incorporation protein HypA/HybF